jgi:hypothetical protein
MVRSRLLQWQLEGYPQFHQARLNLLLHIVAVPTFISALLSLAYNLAQLQWLAAGVSFLLMGAAFAVQGFGHGRETKPSIPFDGPADAVTRIFAEQLITFPRFVLSGAWLAALRNAK